MIVEANLPGDIRGGKASKSGGLEGKIEKILAQGKVSAVKHSCENILSSILV